MKFLRIRLLSLVLILLIPCARGLAFESQIKLSGPKGLVLDVEKRQVALEFAEKYLSDQNTDQPVDAEELIDPFTFEDLTPIPEEIDVAREPPKPKLIDYSDSQVLAAAAASFAKRVKGAIVLGDSRFLQLDDGTLLRRESSFPVRMPKSQQESYTLTVADITAESYTLKIGAATRQINFNEGFKSNSGSIQLSNP